MAIPWYEWRPIRNRLLSYGRAVQGVSPYHIELEPDKSKCSSGYTNFARRLIAVNPTMFETSPEEQYELTKAVLCHEAGHRRFTTPSNLLVHIHLVSNILEDERVERLMEEAFAGIRPLLKKLSAELLKEVRPLEAESDDPTQVLNYMLQLRWATRASLPVQGELSSRNQQRWVEVAPLVYQAWMAETSAVCDRNAEEIVRILGIKERDIPEWLKQLLKKLEAIEGERSSSDAAEPASPTMDVASEEEGDPERPFDGEPLPHERRAGLTSHFIEPKPYVKLVERVQPLVRRLVEELAIEDGEPMPEPSDRGGRLSLRKYLREPERPFQLPKEDHPSLPTISFRVVIDHSTSMNNGGRIEYAAQAAMLLHLAAVELAMPHQVVVTPDNIRVADLESGEMGLALIAGIVPAETGWEDTGLAVSRHGAELLSRPEDIKLLLVLHDGMGNDHELLGKECQRLREKVFILGVGIGMGEIEAGLLKEQFGSDRYIHCTIPEELPQKVGAILRAIHGV